MTNPYLYILVVAVLCAAGAMEVKGTDLGHKMGRLLLILISLNGFFLFVRHLV